MTPNQQCRHAATLLSQSPRGRRALAQLARVLIDDWLALDELNQAAISQLLTLAWNGYPDTVIQNLTNHVENSRLTT